MHAAGAFSGSGSKQKIAAATWDMKEKMSLKIAIKDLINCFKVAKMVRKVTQENHRGEARAERTSQRDAAFFVLPFETTCLLT